MPSTKSSETSRFSLPRYERPSNFRGVLQQTRLQADDTSVVSNTHRCRVSRGKKARPVSVIFDLPPLEYIFPIDTESEKLPPSIEKQLNKMTEK